MSRWLVKALQIIVAVALPILLLTGNLQLVAHMRFVNFEYGRTGFPADVAIPSDGYPLEKAERTALAEAAMGSIIGPEGMNALEEARFVRTGAPAFNAREIQHMRDVRWLFQRARFLFWLAMVMLLGGGAVLIWWGKRTGLGPPLLTRPIITSVLVTLSVAAALGLYIIVNFRSFFRQFHHLFFEGETWLFRPDDTLIRLFPADFWYDAAMAIAGLTALELVLIGVIAWWWGRKRA
jgi:integral membrane protein (TIGR01906 family)